MPVDRDEMVKAIETNAVLGSIMSVGYAFKLKLTKSNHCVLLTPAGCALSKSDRPRVCSLFPSYPKNTRIGENAKLEDVALTNGDHCLAVEKSCGSATKLYQLLGTTRRQQQELANKAFAEAAEHIAKREDDGGSSLWKSLNR